MIDRLDAIAHLSVLRDILHDLAPGGEWQDDPLYVKWKRDRYSLSQTEFYHLIHTLDTFRKKAEYERFRLEASISDFYCEIDDLEEERSNVQAEIFKIGDAKTNLEIFLGIKPVPGQLPIEGLQA